jgi:cyclic beta-1,2-glucan synthetase
MNVTEMAKSLKVVSVQDGSKLIEMLEEKIKHIEKMRDDYFSAYLGDTFYHDIEWFSDNYYMVKREAKGAVKHLSSVKYLRVVLAPHKKERVPAVYLLAQKIAQDCHYQINHDRLKEGLFQFISGFELTNEEILTIVPVLHIVLIQQMAALLEKTAYLIKKENYSKSGESSKEEQRRRHQEIGVLLGHAITSMRHLAQLRFEKIFEEISPMEAILKKDPAKIYPQMSQKSKGMYRHMLEEKAVREKISESLAARMVLEQAGDFPGSRGEHIGFHILNDTKNKEKKKRLQYLYFSLLAGGAAVAALLLFLLTGSLFFSLLMLCPLIEFCKNISNKIMLRRSAPVPLASIQYPNGIGRQNQTMVVICALLSSIEKGKELLRRLEEYYLVNQDENVTYGLLCDLKESSESMSTEDEKLLAEMTERIKHLNEKYRTSSFCLFIRKRMHNRMTDQYMGWERKRGAITELVRLFKGKSTSFCVEVCEHIKLSDTRYLITLDADTRLTIGSVEKMVGAMSHILNRPIIDKGKNVVTEGYGILQPRIELDLSSANQTTFARLFGGQGGVDTYHDIGADIYQDLFEEGIFCGKGIIDVDAFYKVLEGKIPQNRLLSHDIIEGGYLRCGYLSDVVLLDSAPSTAVSWFERLHRWIRGDWQNLVYLFSKIEDENGKQVQNPLSGLTKWKIFDNLIRSASPISWLLSLVFLIAFPINNKGWAGVAYLVLFFWPALWNLLLKVGKKQAKTVSVVTGSISSQFFIIALQFMLLPYGAYVALTAISTTLYRLAFSHKNLLEWVTAAQAESRAKGTLWDYIRRMWIAPAAAVIVLLLSDNQLLGSCLAILFISSIWFCKHLSQPLGLEELNQDETDFLMDCGHKIWSYFETFQTEKDHYLPLDNIQIEPTQEVAHRTSPTNIGLSLLCIMAACDLKWITPTQMEERLDKVLTTIEALPKWRGHLYNWYDTLTLEVLRPAYISSVDSGNFIGSLIALKEGLVEYGLIQLADRVQTMIDGCSFIDFYQEEKGLLSTGYHEVEACLDNGSYDLLASEARQTSFIAIALGQIPPKHWEQLGRLMSVQDGYRGLLSWTGTMFEYFMPNLLLPTFENSLIHESLDYCLRCQKLRTKDKGVPWGISESAFYSFDGGLNYQYKAFGVQKLALKRGQNQDLVISPYSSYLTLVIDKKESIKNLKAQKDRGYFGKYGHFEAVDFTSSRIDNIENGTIIKAFMAHHLGMSLLSLANALTQNSMQKRFMKNPKMASCIELLWEKVPTSPITIDQCFGEELPKEFNRPPRYSYMKYVDRYDAFYPHMMALGSSRMCEVICDNGSGYMCWEGKDITKRSFEADDPKGIFAFVWEKTKGKIIGLTPAPLYDRQVYYNTEIEGHMLKFTMKTKEIEAVTSVTGGAGEPTAMREYQIKNLSKRELRLSFCIYLEPVLTDFKMDIDHPTFSRLFIEVQKDKGYLFLRRRKRNDEERAIMAGIGTYGFLEDYEWENSRVKMLRNDLKNGLKGSFLGDSSIPVDPCVAIRCDLVLKPGETAQGGMVLHCANQEEELIKSLKESTDPSSFREKCHLSKARVQAEDEVLLVDRWQKEYGYYLLPYLLDIVKNIGQKKKLPVSQRFVKKQLWKYAISGDLPILLFDALEEDKIEEAGRYLDIHRMLFLRNLRFDLVIVYQETGEYHRPQMTKFMDLLRSKNMEGLLGAFGGVHLINFANVNPNEQELFYQASCYICNEEALFYENTSNIYPKAPPKAVHSGISPPNLRYDNGYGGFDKEDYVVYKKPPRPFSLIMSNGYFGGIVTSCGGGYSFYKNARENKITRWSGDAVLDSPSEMVWIEDGEKRFSLYGGKTIFAPGVASFLSEEGGVTYRMSDFIGAIYPVRVRNITIKNDTDETKTLSLTFLAKLVLGVNGYQSDGAIRVGWNEKNKILEAHRTVEGDFPGLTVFAAMSEEISSYSGDYNEVLTKDSSIKKEPGEGASVLCIESKISLPPKEERTIVILLGEYGSQVQRENILKEFLDPDNARRQEAVVRKKYEDILSTFTVQTPDEGMNLLTNRWLRYATLTSRLHARCGFYQCGGAYGYRDQLQDVLCFIDTHPEIAKRQILRCACHQFEEGDVQHWWHPIKEEPPFVHRGIRTRHSDSHLWLCLAVCEYVEKTGDDDLLLIQTPYLMGEPLKEGETERYFIPVRSDYLESIYNHCVRAIEYSMTFGERGLCLIRRGDWNDGMNLVGAQDKGESVWLTMFFSDILRRFAHICKQKEDMERSQRYQALSKQLWEAIEANAWDGKWYLRAFWDNGDPLGSSSNEECKIDLLPQGFSILARDETTPRGLEAVEEAYQQLVDPKLGLVHLFTPPFDKIEKSPGYIRGYPPGTRENGGQYTHAAIWLAKALIRAERIEQGFSILSMINPIYHTDTKEKQETYKGEGFVLAADVYSALGHEGEAGWTWYTGAASWYWQTVVELLGFQVSRGYLSIHPHLPQGWEKVQITYRFKSTIYQISLEQGGEVCLHNGEEVPEGRVKLEDDGAVHFIAIQNKEKAGEKNQS